MATQGEVEAYQSVIDGLSTVAFGQVKSLLQSLDTPNPISFRDGLIETYPELMRPFIASSSQVAAQWYSELRESAGIAGGFDPVIAPDVPDEQLAAGVRYSLSPVFTPQQFIGSDVLTLLAGFTQKMIANQGRETVTNSALADPVRVGYARIPKAGCCAFCGLMASRGAVYPNEAAAGGVVGRGVSAESTAGKRGGQGKGVKIRGVQERGKQFHDLCRCVVAPQFVGGDNDYMKNTALQFTEMYRQTDGLVDGSTNLQATLASWRKEHGTK